ncbi:MAG: IS30 family transposase, partial [Verrucomicrobiales bacterium]
LQAQARAQHVARAPPPRPPGNQLHTRPIAPRSTTAAPRLQPQAGLRLRAAQGEFHGYAEIEESYGVEFYFAQPYHSWESGTNENTNGLIRQYLPKGASLENLTQAACDRIADRLNDRPRKRHNFYTPAEKYLN